MNIFAILKKNKDGSYDARLAGDKPIDCGICGVPMSYRDVSMNHDLIYIKNKKSKSIDLTDKEIAWLINGLKWTMDQETTYQSTEEKENQELIERLKQLK